MSDRRQSCYVVTASKRAVSRCAPLLGYATPAATSLLFLVSRKSNIGPLGTFRADALKIFFIYFYSMRYVVLEQYNQNVFCMFGITTMEVEDTSFVGSVLVMHLLRNMGTI